MSPVSIVLLVAWGAIAVAVALRLGSRWEAAFAAPIDTRARRLLGAVSLYLVVPALVLASELLQLAALELLGVELGEFTTYVYWGCLEAAQPEALAPIERAGVAALGPISLGMVALGLAVRTAARPGGAAINHLRVETLRFLLVLAFGLHPLLSLTTGRGDFHTIQVALDARYPQSGAVALLGYGILAAYAFFAWRRAEALRFSTTALHDSARAAAARLLERPDDVEALLVLGRARRAAGDPRARATLEQAERAAPGDARLALALARIDLAEGAPVSAARRLLEVGRRLESERQDPGLLHEVTLALSAARIAQGDAEGALPVAEAALAQDPRDLRAPILLADALVLSGRREEAQRGLEDLLPLAEGELRADIRRRLAALRRG